jgi:hypothetical protein
MMVTVDDRPPPAGKHHFMRHRRRALRRGVGDPALRGEVLPDRPAQRHIDDLHPAADADDGFPPAVKIFKHREFQLITFYIQRFTAILEQFRAKTGRFNVPAARQQQRVKQSRVRGRAPGVDHRAGMPKARQRRYVFVL